jgi:hypothetical protein
MQRRVRILEAQVEQREQTIRFLLSYINLMNRLISVTQEWEEQELVPLPLITRRQIITAVSNEFPFHSLRSAVTRHAAPA